MSIAPFLPFAKPSISQAAIDEVVDCLHSTWITTGPKVQQFTSALQAYLGAPYVIPLSSATAGLHLALLAIGIQPGDEVITTPMTFAATLNTIVLAGATPVLVDINRDTLNIDVSQLAQKISPKTKAIMPVHFAGRPVDMTVIMTIAAQHNLRIIEDAAHAIGTEYYGQRIGSFGDIQVFSFHPNKNITTGEGGCVSTKDADIAKAIKLLSFHGMDREAWNRFGKGGKQDYSIVAPGYKYNMMDLQAALGIHQLASLDDFIAKRTTLVNNYYAALSSWPELILPLQPPSTERHAWHLFSPLINTEHSKISRDEFMRKMQEHNIGTGKHYHAMHLQPYYSDRFGYQLGDFPHAEYVSERIVSLPLFPDMTELDQERVINTMQTIFSE